VQLLLDNGDEHAGGHGTPYLRLHCVLAVAEKMRWFIVTGLIPKGAGSPISARSVGLQDTAAPPTLTNCCYDASPMGIGKREVGERLKPLAATNAKSLRNG
jgi:hypothetical protein